MREDGLRRAKTAALLLLPVLVTGFASGAAAFAAQDETSAALTLAKIHIVARAGGIRMGDVFWAALGQVVRIALLWLCACAGRTLLALGCGALYFEAYSFAFTVSALVVQEGFRGAMLAACTFLPQNLLLWTAYIVMGVLTMRCCRAADVSGRRQQNAARGKYALLLFGCVILCVPLCMLHMVLTLKLMKLLPALAA